MILPASITGATTPDPAMISLEADRPRSFPLSPGAAPTFRLDAESLPRGASALADRQREYGKSVGREGSGTTDSADPAREAAVDFVAMTLIQPILEQMRETNAAAPPFAPTPAERQFGALADAQTARRIARASNFPIVERIAADLRRGSSLPPMPPSVDPGVVPGAAPGATPTRSVDRVA